MILIKDKKGTKYNIIPHISSPLPVGQIIFCPWNFDLTFYVEKMYSKLSESNKPKLKIPQSINWMVTHMDSLSRLIRNIAQFSPLYLSDRETTHLLSLWWIRMPSTGNNRDSECMLLYLTKGRDRFDYDNTMPSQRENTNQQQKMLNIVMSTLILVFYINSKGHSHV